MKGFAYILIPLTVVLFACTDRTDRPEPGGGKGKDVPAGADVGFTAAGTEKIETVDPHFADSKAEQTLAGALFEGLFVPDSRTAGGIPALAERWEVDEGGREYTFYLRKTAWSDGNPLTARTFRDSWLRLLDPETGSPFYRIPSRIIEGAEEFHNGTAGREDVAVEAAEEYVLRVVLKKPFLPVEEIFSLPYFAPVPVHTLGGRAENRGSTGLPAGGSPVCNGPFVIEEWHSDGRITLRPRRTYRERDDIRLGRVEYRQVETEEDGYAAFRNGSIDWLINCRDPGGVFLEKKPVHIHPAAATYYYLFQTNKPPVKDVRVRKALVLAVDRDELLAEAGVPNGSDAGAFLPARGMIPPVWGHDGGAAPGFDPEEARRLFAEAGFPGGKGFPEIDLLINESPVHRRVAETIREQWRETLGVRAALEIQNWNHYLISRRAGAYDAARAGWRSDYQDPVAFLEAFVTGSALNDGRYKNSAFDALVSDAAETVDRSERKRLCAQAEEILLREDWACIPLFHYASVNLIDTGIWGGWFGNVMDVHPLGDIYLK